MKNSQAVLAAAVLTAGLVSSTVAATAAPGTAPASSTATSSSTERAGTFVVTAQPSTTQLVAGRKVTVSGTVTPAVNGARVVLQKRYEKGKPWQYAGAGTMGRQGKFAISDKPTSTQARYYRVVKPAAGGRSQGVSTSTLVTIYSWQDLTSLRYRKTSGTRPVKSITIDETAYPTSLEGNSYSDDGTIDYNLGRDCLKIRAQYGVSDDSDETATGTIRVVGDGAELYAGSFGLTQSHRDVSSLDGIFRLAFAWTSVNTAGTADDQSGAVIAVGTPQVLCAF